VIFLRKLRTEAQSSPKSRPERVLPSEHCKLVSHAHLSRVYTTSVDLSSPQPKHWSSCTVTIADIRWTPHEGHLLATGPSRLSTGATFISGQNQRVSHVFRCQFSPIRQTVRSPGVRPDSVRTFPILVADYPMSGLTSHRLLSAAWLLWSTIWLACRIR
jgi:hypothetical protein